LVVLVALVELQVRVAAEATSLRWHLLQLLAERVLLQTIQEALSPTEPVVPVEHRRHPGQILLVLQRVQIPETVAVVHLLRIRVVMSTVVQVDLV
jgi:hypothetical protein